jgi:hypothetical protein
VNSNDTRFYRKHEKTVQEDVKNCAQLRDFGAVEMLYLMYGWFLERHPEALEVLR